VALQRIVPPASTARGIGAFSRLVSSSSASSRPDDWKINSSQVFTLLAGFTGLYGFFTYFEGRFDAKLDKFEKLLEGKLDGKLDRHYTQLAGKLDSNYKQLTGKLDSNYTQLDGKLDSIHNQLRPT
jgi:hypothetical protein